MTYILLPSFRITSNRGPKIVHMRKVFIDHSSPDATLCLALTFVQDQIDVKLLAQNIKSNSSCKEQILKQRVKICSNASTLTCIPFIDNNSGQFEMTRTLYLRLIQPTKIPIELLAEIFLVFLSADGSSRPAIRDEPLAISHVCSSWRQVALSIPRLWCNLSLVSGH